MSNGIDIYRPGVAVLSRADSPPQGAPTDTSVGFIIGEATQGPVDGPTRITSLDEFNAIYGARLVGSYLYDGVEAFFREGGGALYVSRLADGAMVATAAATSLGASAELQATGAGKYANGMQLVITASTAGKQSKSKSKSGDDDADKAAAQDAPRRLTFSTQAAGPAFTAQLLDASNNLLQQSLEIYVSDDLAGWLATQSYARLVGYDPATALTAETISLAGGGDGTFPVVDATALDTTLDLIVSELGPGQVWAPGKTDPEMQAALMLHAQTHNRVALLDAPLNADLPTLIANGGALRGSDQDRYASLWAPWVTVPGVARGTVRTIPWSSIQAGMTARLDAQTSNANRAAAGDAGQSFFAIGPVQTFTDADRQTLLYAGVNTVRMRYGTVRAYAFRTLSDENGPNGEWVQFNHARLNMQIVAFSEEIGEEYVFSQLDGRGLSIAAFHGELAGMLTNLYDDGALYGDTVEDSFVVNTSSTVNTIETIANGELHAVLSVKMSPHAELVEIEIVKVALTQALA